MRTTAGRSAAKQFRYYQQAPKRLRALAVLTILAGAAAGVVLLVLGADWLTAAIVGGAVAFAPLAFVAASMTGTKGWRWSQGAQGERRTARVLGRLPTGWVVLHDLALPNADWYWAATMLLAGYVLLITTLLRLATFSPVLQDILHVPEQPNA